MVPSSSQAMAGLTLRWRAALLLALLAWDPAAADETEKKLGSPGFRPASDRADAFVKAVGSARITVFPTVVREVGGGADGMRSYDRACQEEVVRLLKENRLGRGDALDREIDPGDLGKLKVKSQWGLFEMGMDTLGKEVAKAKIQSDYALAVEVVMFSTPSKGLAVFGIQFYVLDRAGANAFSFLLNSHHKMFVDAALNTEDASPKGQGELVAKAVRTALKALSQQVKAPSPAARPSAQTAVPAPVPSAPPPEMKVLEKLVGTWKVEHVGKVPEKAPSTGIIKARPVLGGRFVQQTGDVAPGEPDQIGMYTYDSTRKTYCYWFFHSSGFFVDSTGTWNESSHTFTFTNRPYNGATGVITVHFLDEATYDWSIINKDARGEVVYHIEGKAVRQQTAVSEIPPAREATTTQQSPELRIPVLDQLTGNWRLTGTLFKAEWTPQQTPLNETASCGRILAGRFIATYLMPPGGTPHHLVLKTYDAQRKSYRRWDFNANGQTSEHLGQWDAAAKTMTWSQTTGEGLTSTVTDRYVDADTQEWSFVIKDRNGKLCFHLDGKGTRVK